MQPLDPRIKIGLIVVGGALGVAGVVWLARDIFVRYLLTGGNLFG